MILTPAANARKTAGNPDPAPAPGQQKRILLFLDIDGILHPAHYENRVIRQIDEVVNGSFDPRLMGLFCARREALLLEVLASRPHVDLVLSSAWRTRDNGRLDWLLSLLHPEIASRVIGATPVLAPEHSLAPPFEWRRREIRAFVEALPDRERYATGWVAPDDTIEYFRDRDDPDRSFFYREWSDQSRFHHYSLSAPECSRDEVC